MAKKQKRFGSEKAILKAIDEMEKKRTDALALAEEREAHLKIQTPGAYGDFVRKEAVMARRRAERLANKKVELGKALASFRTMLLPMPDNEDNSVTL